VIVQLRYLYQTVLNTKQETTLIA